MVSYMTACLKCQYMIYTGKLKNVIQSKKIKWKRQHVWKILHKIMKGSYLLLVVIIKADFFLVLQNVPEAIWLYLISHQKDSLLMCLSTFLHNSLSCYLLLKKLVACFPEFSFQVVIWSGVRGVEKWHFQWFLTFVF